MTNGNPAFCVALYLSSVHFWGELQHLGEVIEQKIKWRPIRTREIGGVRLWEELIVESPFKNVAGFYAKPFMHVFFCKYCEIFKNTYFKKYLRKSASKCHCQICIHKYYQWRDYVTISYDALCFRWVLMILNRRKEGT